jgi:hypothetical protein
MTLITVVIVGAACSGSSPGQVTPTIDAVTVDAATLKQLNDGQHAFQLSLTGRGRFDRSSYDRLAHAYEQCITEAGGSLGESMQTAYGTYNFDVFEPVGTQAAVDVCRKEYWQPLGPLWSLTHGPTREQIQAGNDALGECLRQAGIPFAPEHPSLDDFHRLNGQSGRPSTVFAECVIAVDRDLKMPGFAGG